MIISPSHTLEYKPNDIIITSSIGYVLLHNSNIKTIRHLTSLVPRLHLQRFGRWSLGTIYTGHFLRLLTAPAPRNGRLDFHHVTVSRGRPWRQSARVRAPLSRCVIARACEVPRTQDAYGLQRADIARVLSVALF